MPEGVSKYPVITKNGLLPLRLDKFPTHQEFINDTYERLDRYIAELQQSVESATGFQIAFDIMGATNANEFIGVYVATSPYTLPAELEGSVGFSQGGSPVTAQIDILKNGTWVGTVSIVADDVSFAFPDEQEFVAGDVLTLKIAENAMFDFLGITLKASF